jgi:hypothetical protein
VTNIGRPGTPARADKHIDPHARKERNGRGGVRSVWPAIFDLTNGASISDEVGEEFDLVEEARGHALRVARELCRNRPWAADLGRYISVTDESGVVVFRTPLRVP